MSATITEIKKMSPVDWQYTWDGTAPFTVHQQGRVILQSTTYTSTIVKGTSTEPPVLEVYDSTDTPPAYATVNNAPYLTIQWQGVTTAVLYKIYQWSGTAWVLQGRMIETGLAYYQYGTRYLGAGDEQWQVIAVDTYGTESVARVITTEIIANPVAPSIQLSYSSGTGNVTISELS